MTPQSHAVPFASFIVATFNCLPLVPTLARTARQLAGLPLEICVSDGGSTDGTARALQGIPGIRLLHSAPDRGIYDAWNRALPHARGHYIGFLGVDDVPRSEFLMLAKSAVANGATPAVIYGDIVMHRRGRQRRLPSPDVPRLFHIDQPVFDLHHPGSLTRADLFDRSSAFDARYRLAGDLDFFLRIAPKVRASGALQLPCIQADVQDDGLSRQAQAFAIYAREHAQIEKSHDLKLGHPGRAVRWLGWLAHAPWLFELGKDASWALRSANRTSPHAGLP